MRCLRGSQWRTSRIIGRNMVKLIDCFVYLISLSPSIRWTMMLWPSACRRRMVSDEPRLIGFSLISAIALRRFSSTGSFPFYLLWCPSGLRTRTAAVPALPGWACCHFRPISLLRFTHGRLHQQLHRSGVEWTLVSSEPPNRWVPTDCGSTPRRRTSYGVRPADGVSIVTPVSSVSVESGYGPRPLSAISAPYKLSLLLLL